MNLSSSVKKLKEGFHTSFWVANGMELFERLAYYGQATILSIFLRDHLKFNELQAGQLSSIFGGLIYLLPIFAGALADKFGFKKAFSFAFGVLATGYFLIGSTGMKIFSGLYHNIDLYWLLAIILTFTAIGGSFIKPSVLGTVALSTLSETKSLGYAIYYWLVNIGAAIGPLLAFFVRDIFGIEFVYLISAVSCGLMFLITRIFYKNPPAQSENSKQDLKTVIINLFKVLRNFRFITFLLIFGLYWVLFWQFFIIIPFYISDYISIEAPIELILSTGAWTIILFQIPVNRLTKNISTQKAIIIGFILATIAWLMWFFVLPLTNGNFINAFGTKIPIGIPVIILGIFTFSIGEQTQAPRFYEYVADLAPKGQAALFQGYAFLPIAIAWGFGGAFGGWVYQTFSTVKHQPQIIFLIMAGIGLLATILMIIYNKLTLKTSQKN
ncbi:MAG: MFS transporter [Melioribacter sp.]|uniref:MFS transporter n=1 Tax=Rosettibacter primus TaxID=3111523 RepID=UPI00247CF050|nr:MFS transporter [Melioribacter sp.]